MNIHTRAWRKLRAWVLVRDGYRCGYCGDSANTVDHVIPRIDGGSDDPANLVACCWRCQRGERRPVGATEAVFFGQTVGDRSRRGISLPGVGPPILGDLSRPRPAAGDSSRIPPARR